MKKNIIKECAVWGVLISIFHLLVFMIPFERNSVFWISYGITLVAFVVGIFSSIFAFRKADTARSKFYGIPIVKVGIVYLLVQILLCFIFMSFADNVKTWIVIIICGISLGIAVIGLVATDDVRKHVEELDTKLEKKVVAIRTAQSKLNHILAQCNNGDILKNVKKFSEEIKYSDPVSAPWLVDIELELLKGIDELQIAVVEEDSNSVEILCEQNTKLLLERNRLCKLNKNSVE